MTTICSVAFAAENEENLTPEIIYIDEHSFMFGDVLYVDDLADGVFTLTTSIDGVLIDRVTMQVGNDQFLYEDFGVSSINNLSTQNSVQPSTQVLNISDFITYESSQSNPTPSRAYSIRNGSLGNILYQSYEGTGFVFHLLSFTSSLINSTPGNFTVGGSNGSAWTVLLAAIIAGFNYLVTGGLASAILLAAGGSIIGLIVGSFSTEINGKAYDYNVTATTNDATGRSSVHGGQEFYGTIEKNGVYNLTTLYDGYYPSFRDQQDYMVANWFFTDFWWSTAYQVYLW